MTELLIVRIHIFKDIASVPKVVRVRTQVPLVAHFGVQIVSTIEVGFLPGSKLGVEVVACDQLLHHAQVASGGRGLQGGRRVGELTPATFCVILP